MVAIPPVVRMPPNVATCVGRRWGGAPGRGRRRMPPRRQHRKRGASGRRCGSPPPRWRLRTTPDRPPRSVAGRNAGGGRMAGRERARDGAPKTVVEREFGVLPRPDALEQRLHRTFVRADSNPIASEEAAALREVVPPHQGAGDAARVPQQAVIGPRSTSGTRPCRTPESGEARNRGTNRGVERRDAVDQIHARELIFSGLISVESRKDERQLGVGRPRSAWRASNVGRASSGLTVELREQNSWKPAVVAERGSAGRKSSRLAGLPDRLHHGVGLHVDAAQGSGRNGAVMMRSGFDR